MLCSFWAIRRALSPHQAPTFWSIAVPVWAAILVKQWINCTSPLRPLPLLMFLISSCQVCHSSILCFLYDQVVFSTGVFLSTYRHPITLVNITPLDTICHPPTTVFLLFFFFKKHALNSLQSGIYLYCSTKTVLSRSQVTSMKLIPDITSWFSFVWPVSSI